MYLFEKDTYNYLKATTKLTGLYSIMPRNMITTRSSEY